MGYHLKQITKGTYGEISKISEELAELQDAESQGDKIMMLCELADIIGACGGVAIKLGFSLEDLVEFSKKTTEAFQEGKRTSTEPESVPPIKHLDGDELLDKTEDEAHLICRSYGYYLRIISKDGKTFFYTMDFRPNRFNVHIENGVIIKCTKG